MMKRYIITEQQNDRIKEIIKQVAETFTNNSVMKTEVAIEEGKAMMEPIIFFIQYFMLPKELWVLIFIFLNTNLHSSLRIWLEFPFIQPPQQ
jgi:hypothetical protein